ncbi:MAG: hypothetical protein A2283_14040 [Lentisphaerae bacterium RIFOXYA12_FULL_48_11]|nr:MAG: hypothetical protein A2283_14040 [Lentisphaerae bacterium RIFOXYA12_FULL_48_11]
MRVFRIVFEQFSYIRPALYIYIPDIISKFIAQFSPNVAAIAISASIATLYIRIDYLRHTMLMTDDTIFKA